MMSSSPLCRQVLENVPLPEVEVSGNERRNQQQTESYPYFLLDTREEVFFADGRFGVVLNIDGSRHFATATIEIIGFLCDSVCAVF